MIKALKSLIGRHREVSMYLLFGVLTTLVGWGVYYVILLGGRELLDIPAAEVTGGRYFALYTAAQGIQWIMAVLFAFFTNRRWVFTKADKQTPVIKQLSVFAGGRLLTLGLDYVITLGLTLLFSQMIPALTAVPLLGTEWNLCEIGSKLIAAAAVIVCNYIISKLFVFKAKQ